MIWVLPPNQRLTLTEAKDSFLTMPSEWKQFSITWSVQKSKSLPFNKMIKFWTKDVKQDKPSAYYNYMYREGGSYDAGGNANLWCMTPDHEKANGDDQEALSELILKIGFPKPQPDASLGAIERAADSKSETVWVLKGLHQLNNPHLTLGFSGLIYHANVGYFPRDAYLSVISISLAPGQQIAKADAVGSWRK